MIIITNKSNTDRISQSLWIKKHHVNLQDWIETAGKQIIDDLNDKYKGWIKNEHGSSDSNKRIEIIEKSVLNMQTENNSIKQESNKME